MPKLVEETTRTFVWTGDEFTEYDAMRDTEMTRRPTLHLTLLDGDVTEVTARDMPVACFSSGGGTSDEWRAFRDVFTAMDEIVQSWAG